MKMLFSTLKSQQSSLNEQFVSGRIPDPLPNGFYKGSSDMPTGPWRGKEFNLEISTGINVFGSTKRFPFKTSIGKGVQNKTIDVLKIDYNIPQNPFWLRLVLDEIVEVSPDKYLGKVHIRLIPALPFTIGYFWLEK